MGLYRPPNFIGSKGGRKSSGKGLSTPAGNWIDVRSIPLCFLKSIQENRRSRDPCASGVIQADIAHQCLWAEEGKFIYRFRDECSLEQRQPQPTVAPTGWAGH
ncbi:hypothetical protein KM043_008245 [Ampulex compressa]|nr:hypothetical protein KM043_008245 [Ampulex compressa]